MDEFRSETCDLLLIDHHTRNIGEIIFTLTYRAFNRVDNNFEADELLLDSEIVVSNERPLT